MKVLFISNFKNLSGWSEQSLNHILSLDTVGIDVVPRNINVINNTNPELPKRIKELEKKNDKRPDIIIQNVLPYMLERYGIAKNICYYMCETSNFNNSGWQYRINTMDEAWVPCYHNKKASLDSGVKIPIQIVPLAVNLDKFNKEYEVHQLRNIFKDDFVFYTIGEWTTRKNVGDIIKAFHLEFNISEPVQLLIKTTQTGLGNNPMAEIKNMIDSIKRGLKLYNQIESYKKEIVVCGFADEVEINSIHQTCDAFVSSSRGESWCIPAMDAMGFGKSLIVPRHGGFLEYCNDRNSFLVDGVEDHVFNATDTLRDLYIGREFWFQPSIKQIRKAMRDAYEKRDLAKRKIQQGLQDIKKYSYSNIGNIMKGFLEK